MFYKCIDCGHIFEEGEQATIQDDRGEFWGMPCSETLYVCPICHGDYEEARRCAVCESLFTDEEMNGGVCADCVDKFRNDFDICYRVASAQGDAEIKINSLLASLLDQSDIEQILKEYIRDKWKGVDCSSFIDEDVDAFGETLAKEVRKK